MYACNMFTSTCTLYSVTTKLFLKCTLIDHHWKKKKTLIITTTNQNKGKIICLGCGKMLHNDLVAIGFSFAPDWLRIAGVI